jgi:hypothetical protein
MGPHRASIRTYSSCLAHFPVAILWLGVSAASHENDALWLASCTRRVWVLTTHSPGRRRATKGELVGSDRFSSSRKRLLSSSLQLGSPCLEERRVSVVVEALYQARIGGRWGRREVSWRSLEGAPPSPSRRDLCHATSKALGGLTAVRRRLSAESPRREE